MRYEFSPTSQSATEIYAMDFTDWLGVGEVINSATVTIGVAYGVDPNLSTHLIGGPLVTGNIITQKVGNSPIPGFTYILTFTATTSFGQILPECAELYVKEC